MNHRNPPETDTSALPIRETIIPSDQAAAAAAVRQAAATRTAIYPIGGGTSLRYGVAAQQPGIALQLGQLNRVVDYPARDMTITVEAGITLATLAKTLASERQRLPIDIPHAEQATLGGVIATDWSGPRRYGLGTMRDYVIGIQAIDGRGTPFKGGGRVVKNVAGYDFCKLLTGSFGTLGVITQVTLKVIPLAQRTAWLACAVQDFEQAEALLAALVNSHTTPAAVELLSGPAWQSSEIVPRTSEAVATLLVGLEGTAPEVEWMVEQLGREWREQGIAELHETPSEQIADLEQQLNAFSAADESQLVVKANLLPSKVSAFCDMVRQLAPNISIQAHAGSGTVLVQFKELPESAESFLTTQLQPATEDLGGGAVVVQYRGQEPLSRRAVWGKPTAALAVMEAIKAQFDPQHVLNPGRFVMDSQTMQTAEQ